MEEEHEFKPLKIEKEGEKVYACQKCGALKVGEDTIVVDKDYIDLAPLTSDPALAEGRVWFRGDTDETRWSPDGINVEIWETAGGAAYAYAVHSIGGKVGGVIYQANEGYEYQINSWKSKAPMPTGRQVGVAFRYQNNIYVIGGGNADESTIYATNEMYDPDTDTWSTKADMVYARDRLSKGGMAAGKWGYIPGGYDGQYRLATHEAYDFVNNTYDPTVAPLPEEKTFPAFYWDGTYVFCAMGSKDPGARTKTHYRYNPDLDQWSPAPAASPAALTDFGTAVDSAYYHTLGGWGPAGDNLPWKYRYEPATDAWTSGPSLPTGISDHEGAKSIGGLIVTFGGQTDTTECNALDKATGTWSTKADMPTGRLNMHYDPEVRNP